MDKLGYPMRTQQGHQQCSVICSVWLLDSSVSLPSFKTIQADRDIRNCYKSKGGGIVALVKNRQYKPGHVPVNERICSRDTELLVYIHTI